MKRKPKKNDIFLISLGGFLAVGLAYLAFKPKKAEAKNTVPTADLEQKPSPENQEVSEDTDPNTVEVVEDTSSANEDVEDVNPVDGEDVEDVEDAEDANPVDEEPQETDTPTAARQHWILAGSEVPAPLLDSTNTQLITMDMAGGCDLTPTGKYRGPRVGYLPKILVIHWGGSDLNNLCAIFKGGHETSSNVGTGRDRNGNPIILQFLDLNAVAWHAGEWRNELSIGIDIAQDPTKSPSFYRSKGYKVEMMNNNTGRGAARCLTIDPVVKKATQDAIVSLCKLFGIPLKIPRGVNGQQDRGPVYYGKLDDDFIRDHFTGVLGHFHTSNNKWDIAPWWEDVMLPLLKR